MFVQEGDYVVMKKEANMKVFHVTLNRDMTMCKMRFTLNGVVGHPYGSSFIVRDGQLVKASSRDVDGSSADQDDEFCEIASAKDNRELLDSRENQLLSKDEINNLRVQGFTGEKIVEQLIENSATFAAKTDFAQQKYIKKKKQKHVAVFQVLKPNSRTLHELYYGRGPTKICNLRLDSMSQILTHSNVRSGSRLMVVESCNGLLLGAMLERMAGCGALVHLYTGSAPSRQALTDGFHFHDDILSCLHSFPLELVSRLRRPMSQCCTVLDPSAELGCVNRDSVDAAVNDLPPESSSCDMECSKLGDECVTHSEPVDDCSITMNSASNNESVDMTDCKTVTSQCQSDVAHPWTRKRKYDDIEREKRRAHRLQQISEAQAIIEGADMDGLIVATKLYPTPIVCRLLCFVKPSRPVVVFSPYKEPLIDCYTKLRETGRVVLMSLSETWLRNYQILPNRTHPGINMSGSGGFLLTATVVDI